MPHADMAEGIDDAFMGHDAVGHSEIVPRLARDCRPFVRSLELKSQKVIERDQSATVDQEIEHAKRQSAGNSMPILFQNQPSYLAWS